MKRLVAQLAVAIAAIVMAVPASADDGLIAKQIIAKLNQHKQASSLKGFDLGVQVDKGTVTMMGQVGSSEQAMLALDVARRVPGVKLVVNDLYVGQQAAQSQPQQPTLAMQPAPRQFAQRPAPTAQPVAYQQQLPQQPQQYAPQYNATSAVGSAVAPYQQQYQPQQMQRPVPYAQSAIRPVSAQGMVRPADYIDGGVVGGGGGYGGAMGGEIVGGGGGGYGGGMGGGAIGGEAQMPNHSWPSYASSPNYGAVSYPEQYSATAWPYIGPFYPYPQVPLGWRKVSLEWDDGWWFLDFTKK